MPGCSCATQALAGTPELLPAWVPPATAAEDSVEMHFQQHGHYEDLEEALLREAGSDAWVWLAMTALNYMACGGPRLLARTMAHPPELRAAQVKAMARVVHQVDLFVREAPPISLGGEGSAAAGRQRRRIVPQMPIPKHLFDAQK